MMVRGLGRVRGLGDDSTIDLGNPLAAYTGSSIQDYLSQAASAGLSPGSLTDPLTQAYADLANLPSNQLSQVLGTFNYGSSVIPNSSLTYIGVGVVAFVLLMAIMKK
jgi:hypothetical protein